MSGSYRAEMWRRLHIRIVFSRMGCFTAPHQDQLSTPDSCIVLLALHAGTGGRRGQWRIALLDPSFLLKTAHTASADGGRAGALGKHDALLERVRGFEAREAPAGALAPAAVGCRAAPAAWQWGRRA
jgi:hypothetical protein